MRKEKDMKAMQKQVDTFYKNNEKLIKKLDDDIIRRRKKLHSDRDKLDQIQFMRDKLSGNNGNGDKVKINHSEVTDAES